MLSGLPTATYHSDLCAQVPWIFVKSQALVKSALQHLRGVDAAATSTIVPATGPPRAVLLPGVQNTSETSPAGTQGDAAGGAGAAAATQEQVCAGCY